jgi:RNA polymerase sigma-70 factor (ECF subfamily)
VSWSERPSAPAHRGARYPERETLFADFQPLVRRLIRQYGEDPELRQDLAGEIYYRFCNLVDAYDPSRGIPLRAYIVRTLTASVYTYSRSQWRRQHREVSLEADNGTVEPAESFIDPSGQWDSALMTQEVLNTLPEAIAELPLRQRQVVIWRYYESRSFEEIAEMLQIRPATARSLLRHGLNNLRRKVSASPLAAAE